MVNMSFELLWFFDLLGVIVYLWVNIFFLVRELLFLR